MLHAPHEADLSMAAVAKFISLFDRVQKNDPVQGKLLVSYRYFGPAGYIMSLCVNFVLARRTGGGTGRVPHLQPRGHTDRSLGTVNCCYTPKECLMQQHEELLIFSLGGGVNHACKTKKLRVSHKKHLSC